MTAKAKARRVRTGKPQPDRIDLSWEEVSGRDDIRQRFRIYRVGRDGEPELVATVGTEEGVGVAFCTLAREGEFEDGCAGLLDAFGEKGKRWLLLPWAPMDNL